jgi:hypothetical protein
MIGNPSPNLFSAFTRLQAVSSRVSVRLADNTSRMLRGGVVQYEGVTGAIQMTFSKPDAPITLQEIDAIGVALNVTIPLAMRDLYQHANGGYPSPFI